MTFPTCNSSGSTKRPWPFADPCQNLERRLSNTPWVDGVSSYQSAQHDNTATIGGTADLDVPKPVGCLWGASAGTSFGWPPTFHQNVVPNYTAESVHSTIWYDQTAIQSSRQTWNTFQGPNNTSHDVAINNHNIAFAGQSAKTLCGSILNAKAAAQGLLYSSEHSSLTSNHTVANRQLSSTFSDGGLAPDGDILVAWTYDPCDTNVSSWNTVGVERELSYLEPVENALQPFDTQAGDADPQAPVQIVEATGPTSNDNNGNNVCFGTICDVRMRFLDDLHSLESSNLLLFTSEKQDVRKLAIVKRDYCYAVQSKQGVDIGVLDTKMTKALQRIDEIGLVTYEAVGDARDFGQCMKTWRSKGKVSDWNLEINMCGPQAVKDKTGKLLSEFRLYLQQPRCLAVGILVDNPHMIRFPNLTCSSKPAQLRTPLLAPECPLATPSKDLLEILGCLDQNEYLELVDVDSRITTSLLNHQRQGVDFLLRRESAVPLSAFSLWQDFEIGGIDTVYQHKITGKRTSKLPGEPCGGILADEMGLGKTLMMLSTILATLNQAYAFCESYRTARNSEKRPSMATLVVAPSALLLDGWIAEVRRHVGSDILRVHKYHGGRKETDIAKLVNFDVVLTTYATIVAEFSRGGRLHDITWFRVVLDEAHTIRNQITKCFRAVASLSAKCRWCLTGTPIQNKLEDLGALVRFLRVSFLDSPSAFRSHFVHPIEAGSSLGFGNLRTLLKCICIRRTKELLHLPEPQTVMYKLRLSPAEHSRYSQVVGSYRQAIDDAVCGRKPSEAYRTILQALLKLRMLCNHGTLQPTDATLASDGADETLALLQEGSAPCSYCREDIVSDGAEEDCVAGRLPACSHLVCRGCIQQYQEDLQRLDEGSEVACPLCKVPLKEDLVGSGQRVAAGCSQISPSEEGLSTKLSKLLEDVNEHRCSDKCIIFSSWKQTLHIISILLSKRNLPFVQLDGSLSLPARREVLSAFQQDMQTPILLMTLGTGAVGLNLTVATRIHIVEPQWNPSIESQAIGRAVRLGQEKQVTVIRYMVLNTVEEYIQSRQSRKLELAELGFNAMDEEPENVELKKLMDLRELLGI